MAQRLIDIKQLSPGKIKLAHSRIYELVALGLIPQPLKIGRRNFGLSPRSMLGLLTSSKSATRRIKMGSAHR